MVESELVYAWSLFTGSQWSELVYLIVVHFWTALFIQLEIWQDCFWD